MRRPHAEQNDRRAELEVQCAGADGDLRAKSAAKEQKPVSGGRLAGTCGQGMFGIKEGVSVAQTQSSNWNNYQLVGDRKRAPRPPAARQPSPRLDLAQKASCSCRAATGLCSSPRDGGRDHPGEPGPPRRSLGDASDAAGTPSEQGRLPEAPRRLLEAPSTAMWRKSARGVSSGGVYFTFPRPLPRGAQCV